MTYNISWWWCCLNPREKNTLLGIMPFFTISGSFIEATTFRAICVITGELSNSELFENFINTYLLTHGYIEVPDEPPLEVYYFDTLFYVQLAAFLLTTEAACTEPCGLRPFPR